MLLLNLAMIMILNRGSNEFKREDTDGPRQRSVGAQKIEILEVTRYT